MLRASIFFEVVSLAAHLLALVLVDIRRHVNPLRLERRSSRDGRLCDLDWRSGDAIGQQLERQRRICFFRASLLTVYDVFRALNDTNISGL